MNIHITNTQYGINIKAELENRLYYNFISDNNELFSESVSCYYKKEIKKSWEERYPPQYKFYYIKGDKKQYDNYNNIDITNQKEITYVFHKEGSDDDNIEVSVKQKEESNNYRNENTVILPIIKEYVDNNNLYINENYYKFLNISNLYLKADRYRNDLCWSLVLENSKYKNFKYSVFIDNKDFIKILTKYINKKYEIGRSYIWFDKDEFITIYLKKYYKKILSEYSNDILNYFNGNYSIVKKDSSKSNCVYNMFNLERYEYDRYVVHNDDYECKYGYDFILNTNMVELYADLRNRKNDRVIIAKITKYVSIEEFSNIIKLDSSGMYTKYNESEYFVLTPYGEPIYLKLIKDLADSFNIEINYAWLKSRFNDTNCTKVINDEQKWKYLMEMLISLSYEDNKATIKFQYDIDGNIGKAEQDFEGNDLLNQIYNFLTNNKTFKIIKYR